MSLRKSLIFGLSAIILLTSFSNSALLYFTSRINFDSLVEQNDISLAKSIASFLVRYYEEHQSFDQLSIDSFQNLNQEAREQRSRHRKGEGIPLVILDSEGGLIFNGLENRESASEDASLTQSSKNVLSHLKLAQGEKVVYKSKVLAYVFFKSMMQQEYNPREEAFLNSFTKSFILYLLVGLLMAIVLGLVFAYRLLSPLGYLDKGVQAIANGDLRTRVHYKGKDELAHLASNFNKMADQLERTEQARQNLLADTAHELRTPVAIIQANLEMLIEGVYKPSPEKLNSLYDETRILTSLISDLRDLSDFDVGKVSLNLEKIDFIRLVQKVVEQYKSLLAENFKELTYEFPQEPCFVRGDAFQINRVLVNLINNALQYAPKNSCIHFQVDKADFIRFSLSDQGPGVSEEVKDKIFERFFRTDASRNSSSGGRGLGLAISKKIVESHGGKIGAFNLQPQGFQVWFELPQV